MGDDLRAQLKSWRDQIDDIDNQLLNLLKKRMECARAIGEIKVKSKQPLTDPKREIQIFKRLKHLASPQLSASQIKELFTPILRISKSVQKPKATRTETLPGSIGIVGLGLMGGSLAKAIAERLPDVPLIVTDRRSELKMENPHFTSDLKRVLRCDLVILAIPPLEIVEFLKEHGHEMKPSTTLLDLASTKEVIVDAAQSYLSKEISFIGGHPLCGWHLSGYEASNKDLYDGKTFFLVKTPNTEASSMAEVSALLKVIGAHPFEVSAEQHDRLLAMTSHLPHLASIALCLTLLEEPKAPHWHRYVAGSFLQMTRIATSDSRLWGEIFSTNKKNVIAACRKFIAGLEKLITLVDANQPPPTEKCKTLRNEILAQQRGKSDGHNHEDRTHARTVA